MARLRITGVAKEADGVGRDDGRVVFVRGALPGELVDVEITQTKASFARAAIARIVEASERRVEPPCAAVALGCGGCDLQHAALELQRDIKLRIVAEAFERIGRLPIDPAWGGGVTPFGYRTTVRCAVAAGRPGFRRHRSHDVVDAAGCHTAHPLVAEVLATSSFGDASEVVIRASAATGERVVAVAPGLVEVVVPDGVVVVGADQLGPRQPAIVERMAGRDWRVSIGSFLQASPAGADLLVDVVRRAVDETAAPGDGMVDLYSGIGLFAGTVGVGRPVTAVEVDPAAVADARVNLAGVDARVVASPVEAWTPEPAPIVIADPSRRGLGARGVEQVVACSPRTVVVVSCDAAAGARDVRSLVDAGYTLDAVTVLDLFPQTAHVELVSVLTR